MEKRWHRIVGVLVGLLIVGGLIGQGVVLAQGSQDEPLECGGLRWRGPCFIEVAAQELGMERKALVDRLRDGQWLSDIAADQGKALHHLTDAFLSAQEEALGETVDQGYFTQEAVAWRLQQLDHRIARCMVGLGWERVPWTQVGLETVAELLGMTAEDLRDELREGKTIAGLAEGQGVELATISGALQEAREEALLQAVEEGHITQEQADRVRQHRERRTELCLIWSAPWDCTESLALGGTPPSASFVPAERLRLQRMPLRRPTGQ